MKPYGKKIFGIVSWILFYALSLVLIRCGEMYPPLGSKTERGEMIAIPVNIFGSDGLNLVTALGNVKLTISGCATGFASANFTYTGSTLNFYKNDTGCLVSLCSFTYNGEDFPNQTPPCGVFNTSVGQLTSFTGTGGANPGGDTVYAYVSKQLSSPITVSSEVEMFILNNDSVGTVNLPISTPVIAVTNSSPGSAPFTVTDATTSVGYQFKVLYPDRTTSSALPVNYSMFGSAVAGTDYTAPSGTITIPANTATGTLTVNLTNNTAAREMQSLGVNVDSSSGFQGTASYVGYPSNGIMITNADTTITTTNISYHGLPTNLTNVAGLVTAWPDSSGSGAGVLVTAFGSPTYDTGANGINSLAAVGFSGLNRLPIAANNAIQQQNTTYTSKIFSVVFKTGSDITTRQVLYEQGNAVSGLNLYIFNNKLYGSTWAGSGTNNNASTSISANTVYSATVQMNSTSGFIRLYVNGALVGQGTISAGITRANNVISGIGGNAATTKFENNTTTTNVTGFTGKISEFIYFNGPSHTDTQIRGIHGYLDAKYAVTQPAVTISAVNSSAGENDNLTNAGFLVTRSFPSASALTVYYNVSGTAVAGTNYAALPGSVTIPAYTAQVYTGLTPINNGVANSSSTLTLTLKNDSSGGALAVDYTGAPAAATTTIVDYAKPLTSTIVTWLSGSLGVTTAGGDVSSWVDQSGNAINGTGATGHRPTSDSAGSPTYLNFNGTSTSNAQELTITTNALLDSAASYTRKTFAFVFRTGSDVTTKQIIWKQGNTTNGMNVTIRSGNMYFTGYGSGWGTSPNSISTAVSTNTLYDVIFEYDQPNGQMRGRVNGTNLTAVTTGVGTLTGVASSTSIGASIQTGGTRFDDNTTTTTAHSNFLIGNARLYEILVFNSIFNSTDFTTLQTYLLKKYGI